MLFQKAIHLEPQPCFSPFPQLANGHYATLVIVLYIAGKKDGNRAEN